MKAITKMIEMLEIRISMKVFKSSIMEKKRVWSNLLFTLVHVSFKPVRKHVSLLRF